ncbi:MAG: type II toxin-antitoxin system RelE/ParE family toxin [Planctomycetaceae bacterium]|nr:type II toxin-antitoxin system RelE/ParE family toxin [Planctomycetaceae bacterium]
MLDVHPEAAAELEASLAWYLERSPSAASAFLAAVRSVFAAIERGPERWPRDAQGFRSASVKKFPFVVHYRETVTGVRVVAVSHTSRDPNYWRGRA